MEEDKLGFPLEYNQLSGYYDVLSQDDDNLKNRTVSNSR